MTSFLDKLFCLEGRVAAITGGGGYLCGEMARGLAKPVAKSRLWIYAHKAEDVARDIRTALALRQLALRLMHLTKALLLLA